MANPLHFKPPLVDPRTELNRRLDAAPTEHAEALLVVWDILESAHDQGVLDAVHGLITAKDTIFATIAQYAKTPEGVNGIRNLIAAIKLIGSLDPDTLDQLTRVLASACEERKQAKPPSLWQLFRRSTNEDSRRGLAFLTCLLSGLGQTLKGKRIE
jgi:uncharacterized protein YjgD (DUF1641 family)